MGLCGNLFISPWMNFESCGSWNKVVLFFLLVFLLSTQRRRHHTLSELSYNDRFQSQGWSVRTFCCRGNRYVVRPETKSNENANAHYCNIFMILRAKSSAHPIKTHSDGIQWNKRNWDCLCYGQIFSRLYSYWVQRWSFVMLADSLACGPGINIQGQG